MQKPFTLTSSALNVHKYDLLHRFNAYVWVYEVIRWACGAVHPCHLQGSAVSHRSSTKKTHMQAVWQSPKNPPQRVQFLWVSVPVVSHIWAYDCVIFFVFSWQWPVLFHSDPCFTISRCIWFIVAVWLWCMSIKCTGWGFPVLWFLWWEPQLRVHSLLLLFQPPPPLPLCPHRSVSEDKQLTINCINVLHKDHQFRHNTGQTFVLFLQ